MLLRFMIGISNFINIHLLLDFIENDINNFIFSIIYNCNIRCVALKIMVSLPNKNGICLVNQKEF